MSSLSTPNFEKKTFIYCSNRMCKYRNYCFRYSGCITEAEAEILLEFLDSL